MSKIFKELLKSITANSVLDPAFSKSDYLPIDLSITNKALQTVNLSSSERLESYINSYIKTNKIKVAYGGYLETRNIYSRSSYFKDSNPENERNIHLGLDLWIAAETPIYTPLDAEVHSFKNNINFGDYGPTIILKHTIEHLDFFTLYGHLSLASIKHLKIGQQFKQGQQIATLGDATINGDYPPHLHFQIIKDIQDHNGDYPGVCSKQDLEVYKGNGFDPKILLGLD